MASGPLLAGTKCVEAGLFWMLGLEPWNILQTFSCYGRPSLHLLLQTAVLLLVTARALLM
jgi:hypothetical protein